MSNTEDIHVSVVTLSEAAMKAVPEGTAKVCCLSMCLPLTALSECPQGCSPKFPTCGVWSG